MQTRKSRKPANRGERHSAAWAKRVGVLLVVLLTASWSVAQSSKLSRDLQALPSSATVSVMVQYCNPPTSTDLSVAKGLGASNGKGLALVKGYRWTMSRGQLSNLISKDSNIKYISLDRPLQGAMNNASLTTAVFFAGQTAPVAAIVTLTEGGKLQQTWFNIAQLSFPYYVVSAGLTAMIDTVSQGVGWQVALAVFPVMYVIHRSYRVYFANPSHTPRLAPLTRVASAGI